MLIHDTQSMHLDTSRVDALIETQRSTQPQRVAFRGWVVQNEHASDYRDVVLELVDCCTLPFSRREVEDALVKSKSEPSPRVTSTCVSEVGDLLL